MILNNNYLAPKKIIIVPYLHERKIHLNRIKQNTKYFYTSCQSGNGIDPTQIYAINLTESKYYVYNEKGILLNRIEFGALIKKHG